MNEMKLLREAVQDTPLLAPAELGAARARLTAAIAADPPAVSVTAVPDAAMSQPYPSDGQPAELPRLPAPAPVLSAVKLMHGGAVGTAAQLIAALFFIGDVNAYHLTVLGHHLTTAQLSHLRPLIVALALVAGLVVIALWLWLARAVGQGRNWARILSTALCGLATLELVGSNDVAQLVLALLTWLTGLAAVWQLWRPAASAFFKRRPRQREPAAPPGQGG
jgi:hypothetical protein